VRDGKEVREQEEVDHQCTGRENHESLQRRQRQKPDLQRPEKHVVSFEDVTGPNRSFLSKLGSLISNSNEISFASYSSVDDD